MNTVVDQAVLIAQKIINGELQPNIGCDQISALCQENNWPRELQIFDLLAHDQKEHEAFGITAKNVIPDIIKASHELVDNHSA